VNTGLYFLPKSILEKEIEKSSKMGKYEFTDFIKQFIKENTLFLVRAEAWFPASYPWNVLMLWNIFSNKKEEKQSQERKERGY